MGLHKTLEVNNKDIDNSLHFLLESPMDIFNAIESVFYNLDIENSLLTNADFFQIERLRSVLLEIEDYNRRHLFSEILKRLGLQKLAKEEHGNIDDAMSSLYWKLRREEIKITSNI